MNPQSKREAPISNPASPINLRTGSGQPVPATCSVVEWGAVGHLIIHGPDQQPWFALSGKIGHLADLLEELARRARREASRYHSPEGLEAAGIVRDPLKN